MREISTSFSVSPFIRICQKIYAYKAHTIKNAALKASSRDKHDSYYIVKSSAPRLNAFKITDCLNFDGQDSKSLSK